jgi:hypothetical protein
MLNQLLGVARCQFVAIPLLLCTDCSVDFNTHRYNVNTKCIRDTPNSKQLNNNWSVLERSLDKTNEMYQLLNSRVSGNTRISLEHTPQKSWIQTYWDMAAVYPYNSSPLPNGAISITWLHPEIILSVAQYFVFTNNLYILPMTTPTKATYYTCKLSSHITRFTLFILDYQHVPQVFMHNYYHNYCHRTTNHYRYIATQGRSHSKNLVTFVRLEDPCTI